MKWVWFLLWFLGCVCLVSTKESFNFRFVCVLLVLLAYVLVCYRVGVARDREDQPEASSSRQTRGEEPFHTITELALILNAFSEKFFV